MKKLTEFSNCELLALINTISQKIYNCFDKDEICIIKSMLLNINQQLCLFDNCNKRNNDNKSQLDKVKIK